jgi:DNA-binding transcriptional LysR family regulator
MDRARRIQMFVRVADAGSFAKAALSLDVTPTAVSHAIAELEKDVRVALFYRTTRQLRLTEDGEAIYQRGRDIVDRRRAPPSVRKICCSTAAWSTARLRSRVLDESVFERGRDRFAARL